MVECPVCKKEISELDESCPYCNIVFDDMIEETVKPKKTIEMHQEEVHNYEEKRTNADCLNFMANINIILSIISAISIWVMFSTTEVLHKSTYFSDGYTEKVINWYGIFGGFGVLIVGFTLFFLLKTVIDIYKEVEK